MFHEIMVPLDSSVVAEQAMSVAAALARRDGAAVHLVSVHHAIAPRGPVALIRWRREQAYGTWRLQRLRDQLATTHGIVVHQATVDGHVSEALGRYVAAHRVDLIVMTSRGRTGWRRLFAGSIGDELARTVPVPLLMLRGTVAPRQGAEFHRILVALDGTAASESAIDAARTISESGKATLIFGQATPAVPEELDISQVPGVVLEDVAATDQLRTEIRDYLERLATTWRTHVSGSIETVVEVAPVVFPVTPVAPAVADMANRVHADLVVLATHERGLSRILLASVADRILHDTACALLVCHPPAAAP